MLTFSCQIRYLVSEYAVDSGFHVVQLFFLSFEDIPIHGKEEYLAILPIRVGSYLDSQNSSINLVFIISS
jgi:hypothetical protein